MTSQPATRTILTVCPYCGQPIGAKEREHIERAEAERERQLKVNMEREFSQRLEVERKAIEQKAAQEYQQKVLDAERARDEANKELLKARQMVDEVRQRAEERIEAERRAVEEKLRWEYDQRTATLQKDYQAKVQQAEETRKRAEDEIRKANERVAKAEEEIEIRVQGRLTDVRKKAQEEAQRQYQQQITEIGWDLQQKENELARLQKKIKDLEAQVESKEAIERGMIQEEQLVQALRNEFPRDHIDLVGTKGGPDITHEIIENGESCGLIIYESKRVRAWQNTFIDKLAREKVKTGADYAVLVSTAFPAGEQNFCMKDGIPVIHPKHLLPFVTILRTSLVAIKLRSQSLEEAELKYQQLVNFLSGAPFKNRLQAILKNMERLESLQQRERKAHDRVWGEQAQLHRLTNQMAIDLQTDIGAILAGRAEMREIA